MSGVLLERDYKNLAQLPDPATSESWKRFVEVVNGPGNPLPIALVPASLTSEIFNFNIALANTEIVYALPLNCIAFRLKGRTITRLKIAYGLGETATKFYSVPLGAVFKEDYAKNIGGNIYLQSSEPNVEIEIITYT